MLKKLNKDALKQKQKKMLIGGRRNNIQVEKPIIMKILNDVMANIISEF